MSTYECRKKAKSVLKGCYSEGVFVVMVYIVMYLIFKLSDIAKIAVILYNSNINISELFVTSDISSMLIKYISAIIVFVVMTPLLTGGLWWFYQTACGSDNKNILKLYTGVRLNIRAAALYALIWFIMLLSLIPTGVCWSAAAFLLESVSEYHNHAIVLFICLQLFMAGVFLLGLYLKAVTGTILAPFIFIRNPDMNAFKILALSGKKIYGSKLECLKLIMTYIPAMLPIVTIPFVLPKLLMSLAVFACDRIGEENWGD
ncbi:MAG: hypothetical protein IJX24_04455 [Oscillospiraceae bacterium]|nr:hypothetical protein [Oscillospiraceae bacterium]